MMPHLYGNHAYILYLIREGRASDFYTLCEQLGISWTPIATDSSILLHMIQELVDAGLLETDLALRSRRSFEVENFSFTVTKRVEAVQRVLGVSLREFASTDPKRRILAQPLFGRPRPMSSQPKSHSDIFVLMPFRDDLAPLYHDHLISVAKRAGMTISRADDFFSARSVMDDIWEAIFQAKLLLADCTGRNPNVFYEVGIAHTLGRPVVLITQSSEDIPFDLRHLRYVVYALTPRGMKSFENILYRTISNEMAMGRGTSGRASAAMRKDTQERQDRLADVLSAVRRQRRDKLLRGVISDESAGLDTRARAVICMVTDRDVSVLHDNDSLSRDLDLDEFDLAELMMIFEEILGLSNLDHSIAAEMTVSQLIEWLRSEVAESGAPTPK